MILVTKVLEYVYGDDEISTRTLKQNLMKLKEKRKELKKVDDKIMDLMIGDEESEKDNT